MKIRKLLAFGVVFASSVQFASAQAQGLNVFLEQANTQTGPSSYTTNGYFAAERVDLSGTIFDPTAAMAMRPNGTTDTLTYQTPPQFLFQTGLYSDLTSFNNDWGLGNYSFSGDDGSMTWPYSGTVANNNVMWTPTPAMVTNYAALTGGLTPGQAFTVDFTAWSPDSHSNSNTTFIELYNLTTNMAVDGTALSNSATSWTMSASDLLPLDSYELVIDDDNRLYGPPIATFQGAVSDISYDNNQSIYFQTVPEPSAYAVLGVGMLGLLLRRRRQ